MFTLFRLVVLLSIGTHQLARWNEFDRNRWRFLAILHEFFLVRRFGNFSTLVNRSFFEICFKENEMFSFRNLHVFLQFMSEEKRKKSNDKTSSKKKKPLIPWVNARNALLAMIRDGSEFIVAIHYLPEGYLWSSKLSYIQVGVFGTCSASLRLLTLFTFRNTAWRRKKTQTE